MVVTKPITKIISLRKFSKFTIILRCGHTLLCDDTATPMGEYRLGKQMVCAACTQQREQAEKHGI